MKKIIKLTLGGSQPPKFYKLLKNACLANNLAEKTVSQQLSRAGVWTSKDKNIQIEYVYFEDDPPETLKFSKILIELGKISGMKDLKYNFNLKRCNFEYKSNFFEIRVYESKTVLYINKKILKNAKSQECFEYFIEMFVGVTL